MIDSSSLHLLVKQTGFNIDWIVYSADRPLISVNIVATMGYLECTDIPLPWSNPERNGEKFA